jgi:hypothetical protein
MFWTPQESLLTTFTGPELDGVIAAEATRRSPLCYTCKEKSYQTVQSHLTAHNLSLLHPQSFTLVTKRYKNGKEMDCVAMDIAHLKSSVVVDLDIILAAMKKTDIIYTDIWGDSSQVRYALEGMLTGRDIFLGRRLEPFVTFHWKRFLEFEPTAYRGWRSVCQCRDLFEVKRLMNAVDDPRGKIVVWARYLIFTYIFPEYDADETLSGDVDSWVRIFQAQHCLFEVVDFESREAIIPVLMVELMLDVLESESGMLTQTLNSGAIESLVMDEEITKVSKRAMDVDFGW